MPGEMGMGGRGLKGGMRDIVMGGWRNFSWQLMVRIGVWTKPCWARLSGTELDVAYDNPQGLEARRWLEQQ